jgi:murein DD-endopeptidase MepM/ murein hydrolase activator NlpD
VAQLPGDGAQDLSVRVLALIATLLGVALPASAQVDLAGTWYVLVHYKDDNSDHPETERWDDRVWVISENGPSLKWVEYPIVVFDDDSGRFERRSSGQYARILHFWEPSESQRADIRDGLKVNSRGSKTKTLRGSASAGWSSGRRAGAASASVLTYSEQWDIESPAKLPVFIRSDMMSGGNTEGIEGVTRYTTRAASPGELSGDYERDGTRHGTFRMFRSASVGSLEEKTLEQRQRDGARQAIQNDPGVRAMVRESIDERLEAVGIAVTPEDLDALTATAVRLGAQGVGEEGIRAALEQDLRKILAETGSKGATHDDGARYRWPFETPQSGRVIVNDDRYGVIFSLSAGTPVVAARDGVVTRVVDGYQEGESTLAYRANGVYVRHADGTVAWYVFLKRGSLVKRGQSVKAGEQIGVVGTTGGVGTTAGTWQPRLQFTVMRLDSELRSQIVRDIRFAGPTPDGVVAEIGKSYGGR